MKLEIVYLWNTITREDHIPFRDKELQDFIY